MNSWVQFPNRLYRRSRLIPRYLILALSANLTGLALHLAVWSPPLQAQTISTSAAPRSAAPRSAVPTSSTVQLTEPNPKKPIPESSHDEPCVTDCLVYTNLDISQTSFTEPSLWWSVRELGERLIPYWIVYPSEHRVEFTIDPQRWNWMNYFERYTLVTQLAYVLRPQGYSFYIFDPQQPEVPIASYTCEFANSPPDCQLQFMN